MLTFVVTLHVVLCVLLVLIILMQPGKGGDVSSAFGGGASTQLFGAAGPGNFLTKGTGIIAGLFMVTSLTLYWYSTPSLSAGGGGVDTHLEGGAPAGKAGSGFGGSKPAAEPVAPTAPATEPASPTGPSEPAAPPAP
ncbi:MAG: preprotein translocase subunit SecG [Pseudomonadota bacterium]|jgi:preprotein translocase subunit SecG